MMSFNLRSPSGCQRLHLPARRFLFIITSTVLAAGDYEFTKKRTTLFFVKLPRSTEFSVRAASNPLWGYRLSEALAVPHPSSPFSGSMHIMRNKSLCAAGGTSLQHKCKCTKAHDSQIGICGTRAHARIELGNYILSIAKT